MPEYQYEPEDEQYKAAVTEMMNNMPLEMVHEFRLLEIEKIDKGKLVLDDKEIETFELSISKFEAEHPDIDKELEKETYSQNDMGVEVSASLFNDRVNPEKAAMLVEAASSDPYISVKQQAQNLRRTQSIQNPLPESMYSGKMRVTSTQRIAAEKNLIQEKIIAAIRAANPPGAIELQSSSVELPLFRLLKQNGSTQQATYNVKGVRVVTPSSNSNAPPPPPTGWIDVKTQLDSVLNSMQKSGEANQKFLTLQLCYRNGETYLCATFTPTTVWAVAPGDDIEPNESLPQAKSSSASSSSSSFMSRLTNPISNTIISATDFFSAVNANMAMRINNFRGRNPPAPSSSSSMSAAPSSSSSSSSSMSAAPSSSSSGSMVLDDSDSDEEQNFTSNMKNMKTPFQVESDSEEEDLGAGEDEAREERSLGSKRKAEGEGAEGAETKASKTGDSSSSSSSSSSSGSGIGGRRKSRRHLKGKKSKPQRKTKAKMRGGKGRTRMVKRQTKKGKKKRQTRKIARLRKPSLANQMQKQMQNQMQKMSKQQMQKLMMQQQMMKYSQNQY
jgi:hypothetical protein